MTGDPARRQSRLSVEDVAVSFGGVHALRGVSFALNAGEIFGLIGTNGAGKSTIINAISGFTRPDAGRIALDGKSLVGLGPERIARAGVVRSFQGVRLFGRLTVRDNVAAAGAVVGAARAEIDDCLSTMGLEDVHHRIAQELPYAVQRRLAMARALVLRPRVLLLDEPAAGMTEDEVGDLGRTLTALRESRDVALLLVEHNMSIVMSVCDRIAVMDNGATIAAGRPAEVRADPRVLAAYLGHREPA